VDELSLSERIVLTNPLDLSFADCMHCLVTLEPLSVGCLVFERMDQIDFTGPFEVLSRMPGITVQIIGKEVEPISDVRGLRLSPDVCIAEAGIFDVLLELFTGRYFKLQDQFCMAA
jgi:hypothetical protein